MSQENQPRLARGRYRARAVLWGLVLAPSCKGQKIAVELELSEAPWQGERITWRGRLDDAPEPDGESSTQTTIAALRACGWRGGDIAALIGLDANEVEIVIDHETHGDRTRAFVKEIRPLSGRGRMAPLTLEQAHALAQRISGSVIAAVVSPPPATEPAATGGERLRE
jgi:hypothetical protein